MQFSLDERTTATLANVNKRLETHGQEKKHALDLKWKIEGPNTILAKFPGLLNAMYEPNATADIPGVDKVRPNLRTGSWIKGPFDIDYEGIGYLLTIFDGPVSGAMVELAGTDVDKFKWEDKGNGHGCLTFTTQHVGLDAELMGRLMADDGKKVELLLAPSELQDGTTPDSRADKGKKAEKNPDTKTKPLPLGDPPKVPEKDQQPLTATDVFKAHHAPAKKAVPVTKKPPSKLKRPAKGS